jgi:hypothetical protein
MLFAKQRIPKMENGDYLRLVHHMVYHAGGDLSKVDNRQMNCVMHAVGGGNWLWW